MKNVNTVPTVRDGPKVRIIEVSTDIQHACNELCWQCLTGRAAMYVLMGGQSAYPTRSEILS